MIATGARRRRRSQPGMRIRSRLAASCGSRSAISRPPTLPRSAARRANRACRSIEASAVSTTRARACAEERQRAHEFRTLQRLERERERVFDYRASYRYRREQYRLAPPHRARRRSRDRARAGSNRRLDHFIVGINSGTSFDGFIFHLGLRFSRKACTPSRASGCVPAHQKARASRSSALARVVLAVQAPEQPLGHRHRHRRRLARDLGGQRARRGQEVGVGQDAVLTIPNSSASRASSRRPVSSSSVARAIPTRRGSVQVLSASGTTPRRTNTKPMRALSRL